MKCAVNDCQNTNNSKSCAISFFSFPSHPDLMKQWILFCDRKANFNAKTSHICMEHFKREDFENNLQFEMGFIKRRFLKRSAVPTVRKIFHSNEELYKKRAQRIQKRENKKIVEMLLKEEDTEPVLNSNVNRPPVLITETEEYEEIVESQNKHIYKNHNSGIECLKREREYLLRENADLKQTLKKQALELRALEERREKDSKNYEYKIEELKSRLTQAHFELNNLEEKFSAILTKDQIAKLKAGVKRIKWKQDVTHTIKLTA